jgi:hypothetical protein
LIASFIPTLIALFPLSSYQASTFYGCYTEDRREPTATLTIPRIMMGSKQMPDRKELRDYNYAVAGQ